MHVIVKPVMLYNYMLLVNHANLGLVVIPVVSGNTFSGSVHGSQRLADVNKFSGQRMHSHKLSVLSNSHP